MKQYAYYPGCSLESLGKNYHISALEVSRELGLELKELEDWNCCGATAYFPVDELLAYTLVSRNLAIAEKSGLQDFVAPCSACYKNAYFTNSYLQKDADLAEHINYALEADNLHVNGTMKVRHLIEVFIEDVGIEEIQKKVSNPLKGLRVAPYYGCQLVRPRKAKEDVENPQYFEGLLSALGAEPIEYASKTRCCGGSLIITNRKAALDMVHKLLQDAVKNNANVIATTCPMCNVNVEVYQSQVNREFGTDFSIPVMYFTQLMGIALGIEPKRIGVGASMLSLAQSTVS
ncbi:MAG: CoB--CoM heterodisulfide reductase iron-sulfur subunit B family protein [Anaerolineales bacterium]|nr:CoB--CoM heterodisulfide reductase iron-sulfur subunit B family protein [Anaerolineales bacterium]